jgi:hypothetical protein
MRAARINGAYESFRTVWLPVNVTKFVFLMVKKFSFSIIVIHSHIRYLRSFFKRINKSISYELMAIFDVTGTQSA